MKIFEREVVVSCHIYVNDLYVGAIGTTEIEVDNYCILIYYRGIIISSITLNCDREYLFTPKDDSCNLVVYR